MRVKGATLGTLRKPHRSYGAFSTNHVWILDRESSPTSLTGTVALTDDVLGQAELMGRRHRRVSAPQSGSQGSASRRR